MGKWGSAAHRYGVGPKTYRSYYSAGFPNLFVLNGPQGALSANATYPLDLAAQHFAHIVSCLRAEGKVRYEVREEVEEEFLDQMWSAAKPAKGSAPMCTPGYYNQEGAQVVKGTKSIGGL